ncbi:MAG: hypothetical protein ACI90V_006712 [Bacillariaceae sp.]|jgi:hypothetical protein
MTNDTFQFPNRRNERNSKFSKIIKEREKEYIFNIVQGRILLYMIVNHG